MGTALVYVWTWNLLAPTLLNPFQKHSRRLSSEAMHSARPLTLKNTPYFFLAESTEHITSLEILGPYFRYGL